MAKSLFVGRPTTFATSLRMLLIRLSLPLAVSLLALSANAQTASDSRALSFQEALVLAQERDAEFLAAKKQRLSADEGVVQAKAQLLPNVSVSVARNQASQQASVPNSAGTGSTTTQQFASDNKSLVVRQAIFRRREWLQLDQARVNLEAADATLEQQLGSLRQRLLAALTERQAIGPQIAQINAQRALATEEVRAVRSRLQAGFVSELDLRSAEIRIRQLDLQLMQLNEAMSISARKLEHLVGRAALRPFLMPNRDELIDSVRDQDLNERLDRAMKRNPEIRSLQAQIESAKLEIAKADAGHWPTVDGIATYTDSTSEFALNRGYSYKTSGIGISVAMPLYAGGAIASSSRQAKLNLDRLEDLLESTRRRIQLEVESDVLRNESILRNLALQADSLSLAKLELEAASQRLGFGLISSLDRDAVALKVFGLERAIESLELQLLPAYVRKLRGY
jgi:protease secretion system outer membrane protein